MIRGKKERVQKLHSRERKIAIIHKGYLVIDDTICRKFKGPAAAAAAAAKSFQSCPSLCDPMDGSPPGPAVPGVL